MWTLHMKRRVSRLSNSVLNVPKIESINPLLHPPWTAKENYHASLRRVTRSQNSFLTNILSQDLVVYTDGGRHDSSSSPTAGGGLVVYQAGRLIARKCIPLSPSLSAFDAEVYAAVAGLETALELPSSRFSNNLWILLDSLDVARRLLSIPIYSSQSRFTQFLKKASEWPNRSRLPHTISGKVIVHWVPGVGRYPR